MNNMMKRSGRGNMPFAVIAVTLLVLAGTYAAVYAHIERIGDNIENLETELDVFDRSAAEFGKTVNKGIGSLISDIGRTDSNDRISGGLIGISEEFGRRSGEWMTFVFPMTNGVVRAELVSHEIVLVSEAMKTLANGETRSSGPVFLTASGTMKVRMASASGQAEMDIPVQADASSVLPFLMERATLFKLAAEDERSFLSNLMSYQLTSLAQYRVMQGFGMKSTDNGYGTNDIITENDVMEAYRNAMAVTEAVYFHTVSDLDTYGEMISEGHERIDLAEYMISGNGRIGIDLAAVYAHTISSFIDVFTGQIMDYFAINKIIDYIDKLLDKLAAAGEKVSDVLRSIAKLFGRDVKQRITAGDHLKTIMNSSGYNDGVYRYARSGQSAALMTEPYSASYGKETISVPALSVNVGYPDVDIVKWDGWNSFLDDYREGTNGIRVSIENILKKVAGGLTASRGLGAVTVNADPYDEEDLCKTLAGALNAQMKEMDEAVESSVMDMPFTDPMFSSMFSKIESNMENIFRYGKLAENISNGVRASVRAYLSETYGGTMLSETLEDEIVRRTLDGQDAKNIEASYRKHTEDVAYTMSSVMNAAEEKEGVMKMILTTIISQGLIRIDVHDKAESMMVPLYNEMVSHIRTSSLDMPALPGTNDFDMADNLGREYRQNVVMDRMDDIKISVTAPEDNGEKNTHLIDFLSDDGEERMSAYTALFSVSLNGTVRYDVRSHSFLSETIGVPDSSYSDELALNMDFDIPVISAWELAGVEYKPSHNIIDDVQNALMKLLEPLLAPLRMLYKLANEAFTMIRGAMIEVSHYAGEAVSKLLDRISGPLERIQDMLGNTFDGILDAVFTNIGLKKQEIGINFHEFRLSIIFNALDAITEKDRSLRLELSLPAGSVLIKAGLDIKKKEDGFSVKGSAEIAPEDGGDWNVAIALDPFMRSGEHFAEISGRIRNTEFSIAVPELVQYEMIDYRLSDIPGIGTMLENIPMPIPGVKGSIDAGVELKYNMPYKHGLVINEFESNPEGPDTGNEWAELYNSSSNAIDLDGYELVPGSGKNKSYAIHGKTIGSKEHLVINFKGQMLNNSVGKNGNGDRLILMDTDGNEVDKTPWKTDIKNDGGTWKRETDGSFKWVFGKSSKGEANGGGKLNMTPMGSVLFECLKEAAAEAFAEMALSVDSIDGLAKLIERTIELTILKAIEMIAGCIIEASVFIEIELADVTGSGHAGVRLAAVMYSDMVEQGLKWITGEIKGMIKNIDNPSGLDPKTILADGIYVQGTVYGEISAPKMLRLSGDEMKVRAGIVTECNLSAICTLLGKDLGTWNVGFGVKIELPPGGLGKFKPEGGKHADLWLIKGEFSKALSNGGDKE